MNDRPEEAPEKSDCESAAEAEQILRELAGALVPGLADVIPQMDGVSQALPDPQDILTGELYRTLLEQIPAVTFMTSFEKGLQEVYVSPQIESILGYSQKEWLASPSLWYQRLHPEDKDRWNREFADTVMSKGTAVHSVYRFLARDGRVVWILGDVRIKRDERTGFPLFVQGVGFDVTDLKKTEEALRHRTSELEAAREELRKAQERELAAKQREIVQLRSEVQKETVPEHTLLGASPVMKDLRGLIRKVAPSKTTALITGENGTGKELVARALHYLSPRATKPFVELNCAALTQTLLESELFGHEKGAFTGAAARRFGKFEQAHGGTLFLDEIGDMPLEIQPKFLKVLEERTFQRVGGDERIEVDVRVICATNHDLVEMVKKGSFREDLYYRINIVHIEVPPLRDRGTDIPELAEHFLARANRAEKREVSLSEEALEILMGHPWPGNVRELRHAIDRAVLVCDANVILPKDLPPALARGASRAPAPAGAERLIDALERMERTMIVSALEKSGWVKARAARNLGLNERVLTYKMNNLGIEKA
jgi:PAS domain S-box-containing protein